MTLSESARQTDGQYYPVIVESVPEINIEAVEILNQALVITIDLWTKLQCAHWNIKGMPFFARHQWFRKLVEQLDTYADLMAERIVDLGGVASGHTQLTTLPLPSRIYLYHSAQFNMGQEYIVELADRLTAYTLSLRNYSEITHSLGDANTANFYNEILLKIDRTLWFLETYLQRQYSFDEGVEPIDRKW